MIDQRGKNAPLEWPRAPTPVGGEPIAGGFWRVDRRRRTWQFAGDIATELDIAPFESVAQEAIENRFAVLDGGNLAAWLRADDAIVCRIGLNNPAATIYELCKNPVRVALDDAVSGQALRLDTVRIESRLDGEQTVADSSALTAMAPQILQTLPDPVFVFELGRGWIFANPMARDLLIRAPECREGVLDIEMPKGFRRMMWHMHERVVASNKVSRIEFYAKHRQLGLRWWSGLWVPLTDETGALRAVFVLHRDVTEKTELQGELLRDRKRLHLLATTDPLTRLSNRRSFLSSLSELVAVEARQNGQLAILLLDVDHFKAVNDTHGHGVGDQVLKTLARIAREQLRPHDLLARWGGEEFIVCLPCADTQIAMTIAERLRWAIEQAQIQCETVSLQVTASFGLACHEATSLRSQPALERLINDADAALYISKREGRNRITRHADPLNRDEARTLVAPTR